MGIELKPGMPLTKDGGSYWFWCVGCGTGHQYPVEGPLVWKFNGDMAKPTFEPSLKNTSNPHKGQPHICHLYLQGGIIKYCADCTHRLAGRDIKLGATEWP